ncbi:hypothetical protein AZI86_13870 [Bdellovibrio bacteriovorus]|uniref:PLD phosphodiesterase domain-containing protein n=1 Tax=Bdellovibrio bacteriovorus TaxID=959 RepID=A0A150WJM8_BDEBC|nr:phospholipase D-like domain-containing protein [Bdellovibrio bacteriovorus]KYG63900.1 hypothetical protein AZI86_13870 [Bdellovibrio bacteriovorus]
MNETVFKPSENCWKTDEIKRGTLLVDSADFYRAVHAAMSRARKSIFILGWDIDSGIALLRGEDAKRSADPSVLIELLSKKARENPELNIYILIWDSSVAFVGEREFLPELVWTNNTPENIHFHLDSTIPLWGSHHQKIILIDDQLVFTGGMDLARQRWDERSHHPEDPLRMDANGSYGPFHDVQIMMDGPIVKSFSEIVRVRWKSSTGYEAKNPDFNPSAVWPPPFPVSLENFRAAVARTIPKTETTSEVHEINQMYRDLFKSATRFIYIENQYFSSKEMARALNAALKNNKELHALLISSYDPQGIFESEAMWANRIDFKRIASRGVENQIRFASSGIKTQDGNICYKRIHSKVLVVDDHHCTVGSANLTNRSMDLDTECDVVLEAQDLIQRKQIQHIRNDLIAEHVGLTTAEVEELFTRQNPLAEIFNIQHDAYRLWEIEDTKFTTQTFQSMASTFADPEDTDIQKTLHLKNPRKVLVISLLLALVSFMIIGSFVRNHISWFSTESIHAFLKSARSSPWSFLIVCAAYVAGGFVLFPVTLMSLLTAAVFGSLWGPIYGMTGALLSAAVMFGLGHWAGLKGTRRFLGDRIRSIDAKFQKTGVIGVTILRLIPIAPYSLVNIAAGISSVRFIDFILGTFLGFLPAFIVKGLVGDSLTQVFLNPTKKTVIYLTLGIGLWILLTVGTYFFTKRWQNRASP